MFSKCNNTKFYYKNINSENCLKFINFSLIINTFYCTLYFESFACDGLLLNENKFVQYCISQFSESFHMLIQIDSKCFRLCNHQNSAILHYCCKSLHYLHILRYTLLYYYTILYIIAKHHSVSGNLQCPGQRHGTIC